MMEGWKEVELEELGTIGRGKSRHRPRNADFLYGDKYPFVQTADVKAAEYKITSYSQMYSEEGLAQSKLWPKDTLCITIAANIADSSILGIDACFPDSVVGFIANPLKSDVRFVKYLFDLLQKRIKKISQGAAQDNLSIEKIRTLRFNVPTVDIQKKIANILSGYDDLIENNEKQIKILEEMAQQTYEEWFVRMRFPGYETASFDENGLPEDWKKVKLGDWIKTSSGGTPSKKNEIEYYNDGEIPWVRTGELKNFILIDSEIKITKSGLKNSSAKLFPKGTVLLAMYGNTIGETSYCAFETSTNQACCGFLVDSLNHSYFIHQYLLYNKEHILSFRMGAAQENISQGIIQNIEIIKPNGDLLNTFGENAKQYYDSIINLLNQNQRLREARDILLPRLMMGMIDVSGSSLQRVGNLESKIISLEQPKKEASKEFKEAVLIACLTERFGSEKFPLGRKRYTKLSYLFHRYSDNKIQDYLRKAAGPYNPKTKYGGPEKIALNNKYIQNWKSDNKLTGFVFAEKIEDAKTYFSNYWQIADLDWLTREFKFKSNDELELLATVDNSLVELSKKNLEFTSANVLDIIKSEKEWEAKLERTIFSDANVERAIGFLRGVLEYNT